MRKLNNRTIFFAVVSLVFGIALSSYQSAFKIASVLGIFTLFFILVIKLLSGGDGVPKIIVASFMLAFFVFGITLGEANSLVYSYRYTYQSGEIVCEVSEVSSYSFVAGNIYVDGEKTQGKVIVSSDSLEFLEVGDVVSFSGYISPIEIFENGELNYYYSSGIQYRSTAEYIQSVSHNYTLKNSIKTWTLSACESMFEDNYGIAYAMIFGDSSLVDYASLSILRRGGVAHIFAVSGLHIGLLYGVLRMFSWLKLRSSLREKAVFNGLCLAVLLFYVYLCDFTASSMRAFLMIFASILVTRLGVVRDRLTLIACVAFILLLHSPYIIFSVGFQLSFLTVVGLVILPHKIAKHLTIFKNKKIKWAVAFTSSACLSTLLVSCFHFGYLSTISVLLNLAVVPIYSLVYIINMAGILLYAVFSVLQIEFLQNAITPFFTSHVFSFTVSAFEKVEEIVPLALYITIPACVVIAFHGIMYANSGLVSDGVNKRRKTALCACFAVAMISPTLLESAVIETKEINFFVTETQVLTIQTDTETVIFCKAGGEVDFSDVQTQDVSLVIFDNYYKSMTVSEAEGYNITLYANFYSDTPEGVYSLEDFNNSDCEVSFSGYQTVEYKDVEFAISDSVTVTSAATTVEITTGGTPYYIIGGVFTSDNTYQIPTR